MPDDPVFPSPGDFYSELEVLKASRKPCEIIFRSENGARTVIRDRIVGQFAVEGQEWIRTGSGMDIPLDKVEQVDGIIRSKLS
jgi:hypothetical protein